MILEQKKLMLYQIGGNFSSQQLHFIVGCLHTKTHELFLPIESMELGFD